MWSNIHTNNPLPVFSKQQLYCNIVASRTTTTAVAVVNGKNERAFTQYETDEKKVEKKQRADFGNETRIKYKKMWQIYLLTQFKLTLEFECSTLSSHTNK